MSDKKNGNLISVILPVFNVAPYLNRCINSVITQSYQNLEIIIIDDGSTDDSGKICDGYAEIDSRIKVFHTENRGISDARNYGFKVSHGDYILYVDPDDYIGESYIEILYKKMVKTNVGFVQSGLKYINLVFVKKRNIKRINNYDKILSSEEYLKKVLEGELGVAVWGKLFKRKVLENVKNPSGRMYEDNAVICYYAKESDYVAIENKVHYYLMVGRSGSITSTISKKGMRDLIWGIKRLTKDCISLFPTLRDEAIKGYKLRMVSIMGMLIRNIPIVYLFLPFLLKKEDEYAIGFRYIVAIRQYISRYMKDYIKFPMKKRLQAIAICYFPWMFVLYIKVKNFRLS